MSTNIHTADSIKTLLSTSDAAVEKALLVIYDRQTQDEQDTQGTRHSNGVGFSAVDAEILSSFACWVQRKQSQGVKLGKCLSQKQMALARKKIARYARQLAEVANAKAKGSDQPSMAYFLRNPRQPWQIISESQALAWLEALQAEINRRGETVKLHPLQGAKAGELWINYGYQVLTVVNAGSSPDGETSQEEEAKEVAKKASALVQKGKAELAAEELESFAARWEAPSKTAHNAFFPDTWDIEAEAEMEAQGAKLEAEMWAMEAQGDREGTLRDETAKMEARQEMERHSLKTYAADPEAREFRAARSKISDWLTR